MQPFINGLAYGSVLAISATGFALVSGTTKGLHLAHGAVMMVGGFVVIRAASMLSIGTAAALLCGIIAAAVVGVVIECSVYWPLAKSAASRVALLLASLGSYLVLAGILALVFGQAAIYGRATGTSIQFSGSFVSAVQQLQIFFGSVVALSAFFFFRYTSAGKLFRAQSDDPELLDVLGGKPRRVRLAAAAAGSALAGLAGGLIGIDIGMDANYGMAAAIAAAVSTMLAGSQLGLRPAMAGIGLGILQAFAGAVTAEKWAPAVIYVLLILVLIRRSGSGTRSFAAGDGL